MIPRFSRAIRMEDWQAATTMADAIVRTKVPTRAALVSMSRRPPIPANDGGNDQSGNRSTGGDPLVESLLSGDREGIEGALCNDPSGLCLGSRGTMDVSKSGVYTSLVRLAAQIDHGGDTNDAPLITIETDKAAVLVKEYDGHTVALRVPVTKDQGARETNSPAIEAVVGAGP